MSPGCHRVVGGPGQSHALIWSTSVLACARWGYVRIFATPTASTVTPWSRLVGWEAPGRRWSCRGCPQVAPGPISRPGGLLTRWAGLFRLDRRRCRRADDHHHHHGAGPLGWAAKVGPRQKSRPGQPYEDRGAVFIGFTLGSFLRARRPSRCAAPTMRATAMSESKASWTARRALALSGGSAAPAGKAADFVGKLTAQVSHVRLLAIRRPGDPPPIGNAPSWKALLRWCSPWIGPVRHHGHVAPPFACLPWRRGPRPAS
jgi:hypothetical protein